MNKFFKWGFIAAGICMLLGVLLALICAAVGGTVIVRDSAEYLRAMENIGILDDTIEFAAEKLERWDKWDDDLAITSKDRPTELYVNGSLIESNIDSKWQVQMNNITKLHMEVGAGEFYIKEKDTDDQTIDISISGLGKSNYYVKNDTLYIEGFMGNYIGKWSDDNEIIVELPKGVKFDQIELEIGAGRLEVQNLLAKSADIEIGAGEVIVEGADIQDYFSAEIGAGRLETRNMKAENVELSLSLGECLYQGEIVNNLDAECNMGSMELLIEGGYEDHNYEIECAAGTIDMDGYSFGALAAEKNIDNGAAGTFDISCSMGEIRIGFND